MDCCEEIAPHVMSGVFFDFRPDPGQWMRFEEMELKFVVILLVFLLNQSLWVLFLH